MDEELSLSDRLALRENDIEELVLNENDTYTFSDSLARSEIVNLSGAVDSLSSALDSKASQDDVNSIRSSLSNKLESKDIENLATKSEIPDVSEFLTNKDLPDTSNFLTVEDLPDTSGKEDASNKVTELSSESTDVQYPSAKAVYNALQEIDEQSIETVTEITSESTDDEVPSAKSVYDLLFTTVLPNADIRRY